MQIKIKYSECPHCQNWHLSSQPVSYTKRGSSECWSDGKCTDENNLQYSFMLFSKCNRCKQLFWFEDCRQFEHFEIVEYLEKNDNNEKMIEPKELDEKSKNIVDFLREHLEDFIHNSSSLDLKYPPPNYLLDMPKYFIPDLLEILKNTKNIQPENEIYIRTKLWQHINDLVRNKSEGFMHIFKSKHKNEGYNKKMYENYNEIRLKNLKQLSELLQKVKGSKYENAEINLVEIEREQGNFDKAKLLIENLDPIDKQNHKVFINKSLKMIREKSTEVFNVPLK